MEHSHSHHQNINLNTAFKIGITINIIFIVIETIYGFLANSMALVADAGHNFSDVIALAFSWIAVKISQRKPTMKFTYGFRRSTILIALLNTIILLIAVAFILLQTIERLRNPSGINANSVMIVASAGIAVNGFTAWLFMKDKKHDLNIRSAYLHFIADALVSFGVVIAAVIMAFTGIIWVDAFMSFTIIAVILYSSYHLLIDSINLALDAVPGNIDFEEIRKYLAGLPGVTNVHDLHIWALSTTDAALTVHLVTNHQTDVAFISGIQQQLNAKFSIGHSTIQVEHGHSKEDYETNCN